jgi:hypothetical protein
MQIDRKEHTMFWQKLTPPHSYRFIAVLEIEERGPQQLYGKRTFRFKLADGTHEEKTFEAQEWSAWQASIMKGGVVVNA